MSIVSQCFPVSFSHSHLREGNTGYFDATLNEWKPKRWWPIGNHKNKHGNIYILSLSYWIQTKDATLDMGSTCKWTFNCHYNLLADVYYVVFMEPATRQSLDPPPPWTAPGVFWRGSSTNSLINSVTRHVSHCGARRGNTAGIIAFLRGYTQTHVAAATIACAAMQAPRAQSPRQLSLAPLLSVSLLLCFAVIYFQAVVSAPTGIT